MPYKVSPFFSAGITFCIMRTTKGGVMEKLEKEPTFKEWVTDHAHLILMGGGVAVTAIGVMVLHNTVKSMNKDLEHTFYQIGRDFGTLKWRVDLLDITVADLKK
jgi:predicted hydrocarbon binding protein